MHDPAITQHPTNSQAHDIPDSRKRFPVVPAVVRRMNFFFHSFIDAIEEQPTETPTSHPPPPTRMDPCCSHEHTAGLCSPSNTIPVVRDVVCSLYLRPTVQIEINPSFMGPQMGLMHIYRETTLS
jgi:hypothetical protein